jgi:hypothetical protein
MSEKNDNFKKTLSPARDSQFLIDGSIEFICRNKKPIEISVLIDMNKNFKDSPLAYSLKNFLIKEDAIIYTAGPKRENPSILANGISELKEGDLLALETEDSVVNILNQDIFSAVKLWRIVMTET